MDVRERTWVGAYRRQAKKKSTPGPDADGPEAIAAGGDMDTSGSGDATFALNPLFPEMPASVPLTYTLIVHACLRAVPEDRPTFEQVRPKLALPPNCAISSHV